MGLLEGAGIGVRSEKLSNEFEISRGAENCAKGRGAERGKEGILGVVSQVVRGDVVQ